MSARGNFSSRIGFVLAAAGSAVGLGNIWKFPFEVEAGGGAIFVVLYLTFCFILCFPVMVAEIAIGRKTNKNTVGAFTALGHKKWAFIGLVGILAGIFVLSFYNVVSGWALGYVFEMVQGNFNVGSAFEGYISNVTKVGIYAVFFMLTTAFIVSKGVSGGIEKAAKILMPTLIIMIACLAIYAFTLPNAMTGITFYLIPEFSEIDMKVIGGALRQSFFSLSLGMGALITYGSYLSKKENIISSATYITLFDVGIAFLAGLMLFPLVAYNLNGDMSNIQGGAGLIFVTLPAVFQSLGSVLGTIVGAFFFLLLSFAALTSTVSLLEVPVAYLVDEFKMERKKSVWIVSAVIFLAGIPTLLGNGYSAFFTKFITYIGAESPVNFDTFLANIADVMLLLGGCLIVSFVAYVWKKENLHEELSKGNEKYDNGVVKKIINFQVAYLTPLLLAIMLVLVIMNHFFGFDL